MSTLLNENKYQRHHLSASYFKRIDNRKVVLFRFGTKIKVLKRLYEGTDFTTKEEIYNDITAAVRNCNEWLEN